MHPSWMTACKHGHQQAGQGAACKHLQICGAVAPLSFKTNCLPLLLHFLCSSSMSRSGGTPGACHEVPEQPCLPINDTCSQPISQRPLHELLKPAYLASMREFATPWPTNPATRPARLYSRNLTPRQAVRSTMVYCRTPSTLGSNTAEGTRFNARCQPAQQHLSGEMGPPQGIPWLSSWHILPACTATLRASGETT